MSFKLLFSLILLSIAIIAYQLNLMQVLSIMQWYHFAYMIISIALMGFGTAGTFLAIFRNNLLNRFDNILPWLMLISGITMPSVVALAQLPLVGFDSYLLFSDSSHIFKLAATYILFLIPFFFAALAIGLIFIKYIDRIGKLYFANLLGSGLGGLAAIILILVFFPAEITGIVGILPILASFFIYNKKRKLLFYSIAFIAAGISVYFSIFPAEIKLSQFKSLSSTKNLPGTEILFRENSPYGLIEVASSPALRYAPGLSLTYREKLGIVNGVFINGDWAGPLISRNSSNNSFILDYTPSSLPYRLSSRKNVLVLNSGTGKYIQHSLVNNAEVINAVEPNGNLVSLLQNELPELIDSVYNKSPVSVSISESRTYLYEDENKYDLIILPEFGAFGGTSGLYAMQENYLLTVESINQMWDKLSDDGVISITCWMDYPHRNPLKLLALIIEVLSGKEINKPQNHIASVRGWATISFVIKKTPLNDKEISSARNFCDEMLFDPVILPGLTDEERSRYNILQDEKFFDYIDSLLSDNREQFVEQYDFNISPPVDNKPYFSQFIKWSSIAHLSDLFGGQAIPFFEIGYIIVVITFIQIIIFAFILILLPLFKIGFRGNYRFWTILYFGGIGIGFMFVEIIFIQKFILYFGNPVYSVAAVIAFMLICAGAGSYFSSKLNLSENNSFKIFGIIIALLLLYSFLLTTILQSTISYHIIIKVMISLVVIGLPAFAMGIPFPLGLKFINQKNDSLTPWAWGINGVASVLSTALATILAVEIGFGLVLVFAACTYFVSFLAAAGSR